MIKKQNQDFRQLVSQILGTVSQESLKHDFLFIDPLKLITSLSFSHLSELIKIEDPIKR